MTSSSGWAALPADFSAPRPASFDNGYMKLLFALGERLGLEGCPWAGLPRRWL
jgi:hypothetical protein